MVHYRRSFIKGASYFFTLTLNDRTKTYLTDYINDLKAAMQIVKKTRPYHTQALVILPEHLHAIWKLPENDSDYATRWRLIKRTFTKMLKKHGLPLKNNDRGACNIWQSRYWEHTIRDERDLENHINYIHFNPVKHHYVTCAKDWPYSTFHEYVRQGILDENWGAIDDVNLLQQISQTKKEYGD